MWGEEGVTAGAATGAAGAVAGAKGEGAGTGFASAAVAGSALSSLRNWFQGSDWKWRDESCC